MVFKSLLPNHTQLCKPPTVNVLFLNMAGHALDLSYQATQQTLLFPVSAPGIFNKPTKTYTPQVKAHASFNSTCVRLNVIQKVHPRSLFTPLKGCGMLPFSLTRGQSLPSLYSEFGLGTLSEWVVLKQLVCHSNLSTAAVLWIWLHLADSLPLWCGSLQWLRSLWHFMVAKFWGKGHLYCRHSGRKTFRCLQEKPSVS